jgi:hypothetical protein
MSSSEEEKSQHQLLSNIRGVSLLVRRFAYFGKQFEFGAVILSSFIQTNFDYLKWQRHLE